MSVASQLTLAPGPVAEVHPALPWMSQRFFPVPDDNPFVDLLKALDRIPDRTSPREARKPARVLPLALLAVALVLAFSRLAARAVWELSGERYVDDVLRHELQKARTTPALN